MRLSKERRVDLILLPWRPLVGIYLAKLNINWEGESLEDYLRINFQGETANVQRVDLCPRIDVNIPVFFPRKVKHFTILTKYFTPESLEF